MGRIARVGLAVFLSSSVLSGCGTKTSDNPTTRSEGGGAGASTSPATEAIAQAAADFLDAILQGDTQRASARLTPQAIERIIASGIQFQPQGLQTADFKIGEIRTPSQDQAIVQCVLTDQTPDGLEESEEMCCLMRHVENDWRVSGIAYGKGPNQPWTLTDFETGHTTAIPRQPTPGSADPAGAMAGRPSPPAGSGETAPGTVR